MRVSSVIILSGLTFLLSACGGGKTLSFKNSDEVIKSYTAVTKNLTEAERLEFRRNLFLVAWTAEKPDDKVSFSDVQTAWEYERNTVELTGPDAAPLAKELALKGVSKLDGKTVSQVNALGENLSGIAVTAQVKSIEGKIETIDTAIAQLNTDKETWSVRNKEAAAAEAALVEQTKIYKPDIISEKIGKNWQGPVLSGKVTLASPHPDPINDFRNNFTIEHNGHRARFNNVLGQFTRYRQEFEFNLNLNPASFLNETGDSLPKDFVMPKDLSSYSYSFRPAWVRTSGKVNGWQEHEYKLSPEQYKALYNLTNALKSCDQSIEVAMKLRASFETQITQLKNDELDELHRVSGRFAESCL